MSMSSVSQASPIIGVFASDRGPGDPERASLMGQVGTLFARRGAHLVCLAEKGVIPVPLITAARAAGGAVDILADESVVMPPALSGVPIEIVPDQAERYARIGAMASAFVVLPGSLASISALFGSWKLAKPKPVVMLNRHRAFDIVRGFAGDVMSHSLPGYDRSLQFADSVEDLWNKVVWVGEQRR